MLNVDKPLFAWTLAIVNAVVVTGREVLILKTYLICIIIVVGFGWNKTLIEEWS